MSSSSKNKKDSDNNRNSGSDSVSPGGRSSLARSNASIGSR
jgi:hypothetical protein